MHQESKESKDESWVHNRPLFRLLVIKHAYGIPLLYKDGLLCALRSVVEPEVLNLTLITWCVLPFNP